MLHTGAMGHAGGCRFVDTGGEHRRLVSEKNAESLDRCNIGRGRTKNLRRADPPQLMDQVAFRAALHIISQSGTLSTTPRTAGAETRQTRACRINLWSL